MLRAGADKVSLNTAAVDDPDLIGRCARRFGRQAVVVAIDARRRARRLRVSPRWEVVVQGGRTATGLDAIAWAQRAVELGAGELLRDLDRPRRNPAGFDLRCCGRSPTGGGARRRVRRRRRPADFVAALVDGHASAVLAASIFHRRLHSIAAVKAAMAAAGIPVRPSRRSAA